MDIHIHKSIQKKYLKESNKSQKEWNQCSQWEKLCLKCQVKKTYLVWKGQIILCKITLWFEKMSLKLTSSRISINIMIGGLIFKHDISLRLINLEIIQKLTCQISWVNAIFYDFANRVGFLLITFLIKWI